MTAYKVLLATLIVCSPPAEQIHSGRVVYYARGVMERVAANRQNPHHRGYVPGFRLRTDVDGYASRPSCRTIGQVWAVRILNPRTGRWGRVERVQQVDCAQTRHYAQQVRSGLILEVDYKTAQRNGFVRAGKTKAIVWRAE